MEKEFVLVSALIIISAWLILDRLGHIMLDLAACQAKLADLKTSVDALIARPANPAPVDLQPLGDAIDSLKGEVDTALAATPPA